MKKILIFVASFFASINIANASSISSISMDIKLDEKGNATITETWIANVSQGTEGWHPYYNLKDSEIIVKSASMDGKEYTIEDEWDEHSSLDEKAYKAGLYNVDGNEHDIVFGISKYGPHIYEVVYEITNFVKKTSDADMIYWNLFPNGFSMAPGKVDIKISGPNEYPDDIDVWGYGKYGALCYVHDGAIYMSSDGESVGSAEYFTLLAKFPSGTFDTESVLDEDFEHYHNMAQEGAEIYKSNSSNKTSVLGTIISIIAAFFWPVMFMIIIVAAALKGGEDKYDYGEEGKELKDVNNFRDIPCNKNIFRAFFISNIYGLTKKENDFMGVLLLKWIKDGNVKVETIESKGLLKNKEADVITFIKEPETDNEYERNLYRYMLEASGDNKLEKDEFKKWCKKHYNKVLNWSKDVLKHEKNLLISEGLLTETKIKKGHIIKYTTNVYKIEDKLKEEAKQLKGLKQFLIEFSEIKKKEPIEVKLWNEYLMYAQIFGIADRVMKKFKDLYPEVIKDMEDYNFSYSSFVFIDSVSSSGVAAASAARSAAQSYSGGGGGFSSGGGGGGSFGGGGGGGGFR